ncbi:hypothetical protein [Pedobacter cryotolerans]|uniref:Uncharacterized protein n=1 Tax=Pedobacter cryotolerans TaxID=2571270 RepID=A0A4U1C523_9SPHI|nr:hypothetical protein [Pedobacter cryotolerans]TKB99550.1 hypothetical protein FA045_11570 [Pedobacter cryotolerans]
MRFLTTCLLLFCFQSFVVCTAEDGTLAFVQEAFQNKEVVKKSSSISNKQKLTQTFNRSFVIVDIANQPIVKLTYIVNFYARKEGIEIYSALKTALSYGCFLKKHYSFILNHLYPKHTFW